MTLLFIDYPNAFGSLDRLLLLNILVEIGVPQCACNVMRDYFTNGTHFKQLSGRRSFAINCRVLEGSSLSNFLFSYDECLPIPSSYNGCKYADVVPGCTTPIREGSSKLQGGLEELVSWSSSRRFSLKRAKCCDITLSFLSTDRLRIFLHASSPVVVSDQLIPHSHSVKYLGVFCPTIYPGQQKFLKLSKKPEDYPFAPLGSE